MSRVTSEHLLLDGLLGRRYEHVGLPCRSLDALACDVEILLVCFDSDEAAARLNAGNASRSAAHEWVQDQVAWIGKVRQQLIEQAPRLFGWMSAVPVGWVDHVSVDPTLAASIPLGMPLPGPRADKALGALCRPLTVQLRRAVRLHPEAGTLVLHWRGVDGLRPHPHALDSTEGHEPSVAPLPERYDVVANFVDAGEIEPLEVGPLVFALRRSLVLGVMHDRFVWRVADDVIKAAKRWRNLEAVAKIQRAVADLLLAHLLGPLSRWFCVELGEKGVDGTICLVACGLYGAEMHRREKIECGLTGEAEIDLAVVDPDFGNTMHFAFLRARETPKLGKGHFPPRALFQANNFLPDVCVLRPAHIALP